MHAAAPPVQRDPAAGVVGGVCAGLAPRLGLDPLLLRVVFVVGATAGGAGLVLYLLLWALLPAGEGAMRLPRLRGAGGVQVAAGIGLLVLSLLLLFRAWGLWVGDALVWPLTLVASGAALLWRQSQKPGQPAATAEDAPARPRERPAVSLTDRLGAAARGRAALGAALVVGGGLVFLWLNDALRPARDVLLAVVVVVVAAGIILAPWWLRLARGLAAERAERIRSQERAELAAHLHDSVLQTLALVQRRAEDPRAVATLARRQERELRAWLNGARAPGAGTSLVAALERAAADVEDAHGVVVDAVTVGDCPLDERTEALAAAAREALVNAAKFAGEQPIALYAEVTPERVEVFVRDRGPGFDLAAVPPDRRGVRESIVGRMQRHGGRAVVASPAGAGTEVELVMER
ncbi:MAG TPA: PspC domain-containing protein [Solirubrobacteraceae bacterium]|nr:PspC domain-containing protein [Solirubrobacteraceae bacterium]